MKITISRNTQEILVTLARIGPVTIQPRCEKCGGVVDSHGGEEEMSKYFTSEEMTCHCGCGESTIADDFITMLDDAREFAGIPFPVSSGFRCGSYDTLKRGEGNHPTGRAVDIQATFNWQKVKIVAGLLHAGFRRIGISWKDGFIHVDSVHNRPDSMWTY